MDWKALLGDEKRQQYFIDLITFIEDERQAGIEIYPPNSEVFNAFSLTSPQSLKVVIIGQDPYHGPNQANGLAFSVKKGNSIPPSLRNIFKCLEVDIDGFESPSHGDLTHWAEQGVLLLNTVLTVRRGQANSHKQKGWETFTDHVIRTLNASFSGLIFMLWGTHAHKKSALLDTNKHHVLMAPHPSPLSAYRGFFDCQHFRQANLLLERQGNATIDWHLPR